MTASGRYRHQDAALVLRAVLEAYAAKPMSSADDSEDAPEASARLLD